MATLFTSGVKTGSHIALSLILIFLSCCDDQREKRYTDYGPIGEPRIYTPSQIGVTDDFEIIDIISKSDFDEIVELLFSEYEDWRVLYQRRGEPGRFIYIDRYLYSVNGWIIDLTTTIAIQKFGHIIVPSVQHPVPPSEGE